MTTLQKQELKTKIGEAIGHASMCWNPRPGDIVFDTEEASKVVDDLYEYVHGLLMKQSS
jgi:hypothetical protein